MVLLGPTAFHIVQVASGLFAEELHLFFAGGAPMGSKKPGAHRVELLGQLDRLCCGLRCGLRNRLVPRLCSRCGAQRPRQRCCQGQNPDALGLDDAGSTAPALGVAACGFVGSTFSKISTPL